jgi:hypothetical protein
MHVRFAGREESRYGYMCAVVILSCQQPRKPLANGMGPYMCGAAMLVHQDTAMKTEHVARDGLRSA